MGGSQTGREKTFFWNSSDTTSEVNVEYVIIIIIIIIIIYYNWVVSRWQWLFYMYTKHEIGY